MVEAAAFGVTAGQGGAREAPLFHGLLALTVVTTRGSIRKSTFLGGFCFTSLFRPVPVLTATDPWVK